MQKISTLTSRAASTALLFAGCLSLSAQTAPASTAAQEDPIKLEKLVVTGVRASVTSSEELKREKFEIVDSVVASDINKLPDYNVTDALQRITGIQILRDRGEGAGGGRA